MSKCSRPPVSRCLSLLVLLLVLTLPDTLLAGPFRTLGYDTSTQSTANSNICYGDSLGVLYTNPAVLSRFPDMAEIGITFWMPNMNINLMDKPTGSDVPITIYASKMGNDDSQQDLALPTIELRNKRRDTKVNDPYAYVGFGTSMSFGIKGFRFANLMLIPIDSLNVVSTKTHYSDELEQHASNQVHYMRFGEWGKGIDGLLGVSYSPIKYISFGISLKIGVTAVANVDIYVPDATVQDYTVVNNGADAKLALKPIVGIQAEPLDWMSLGLTWRYWSYMNMEGRTNMGLWQFHETSNDYIVPKIANQNISMAIDYEPMELSGGVGFKTHGFTTQAMVTWEMWHFYLDDHHKSPQDAAKFPSSPFYDDPIEKFGLENKFKFKDTVSVAWSGQYKYYSSEKISGEVKAGFAYSPSPVPAQIGRTNYADSDVFLGSVGHKLDFTLFEKHFGVDVGLQYWQMRQRKVYKDPSLVVDEFADDVTTIVGDMPMSEAQGLQTNNPGFPGYEMDGWIVLAGVQARYEF